MHFLLTQRNALWGVRWNSQSLSHVTLFPVGWTEGAATLTGALKLFIIFYQNISSHCLENIIRPWSTKQTVMTLLVKFADVGACYGTWGPASPSACSLPTAKECGIHPTAPSSKQSYAVIHMIARAVHRLELVAKEACMFNDRQDLSFSAAFFDDVDDLQQAFMGHALNEQNNHHVHVDLVRQFHSWPVQHLGRRRKGACWCLRQRQSKTWNYLCLDAS
jgi:hypothetical protein